MSSFASMLMLVVRLLDREQRPYTKAYWLNNRPSMKVRRDLFTKHNFPPPALLSSVRNVNRGIKGTYSLLACDPPSTSVFWRSVWLGVQLSGRVPLRDSLTSVRMQIKRPVDGDIRYKLSLSGAIGLDFSDMAIIGREIHRGIHASPRALGEEIYL